MRSNGNAITVLYNEPFYHVVMNKFQMNAIMNKIIINAIINETKYKVRIKTSPGKKSRMTSFCNRQYLLDNIVPNIKISVVLFNAGNK